MVLNNEKEKERKKGEKRNNCLNDSFDQTYLALVNDPARGGGAAISKGVYAPRSFERFSRVTRTFTETRFGRHQNRFVVVE